MNIKSRFVHSTDYTQEYITAYYKSKYSLSIIKISFWANLLIVYPFVLFVLKYRCLLATTLFVLGVGGYIVLLTYLISYKSNAYVARADNLNNSDFIVEIDNDVVTSTLGDTIFNRQPLNKITQTHLTDNFLLIIFENDSFIPVFLADIGDKEEQKRFVKQIRKRISLFN